MYTKKNYSCCQGNKKDGGEGSKEKNKSDLRDRVTNKRGKNSWAFFFWSRPWPVREWGLIIFSRIRPIGGKTLPRKI